MFNQLSFLKMSAKDFLEPIEKAFSNSIELENLFFRYGWDIRLDDELFQLILDRVSVSEPLAEFTVIFDEPFGATKTKSLSEIFALLFQLTDVLILDAESVLVSMML